MEKLKNEIILKLWEVNNYKYLILIWDFVYNLWKKQRAGA